MRTKKEIFQDDDPSYFLLKCSLDPSLWFTRVLGMDIQDYHREWIDTILRNRFVCIQAHRGSGKTYIAGFGMITWLLWFGRPDRPGEPVRCIVTSAAKEQSIKTMEEISHNLAENELLSELIPEDRSKTWSKTELTTKNHSKVYCKAYNANIRGYHVDYVLCDEGGLYTDQQMFYQAVSPIVNNRKGTLVVIGTPTSEVDLLQDLSRNPEYWTGRYPVYVESENGTKRSLWPSRFSLKEIDAIRKRDGESSFQKEYLLNPRGEADNSLFPAFMVADCFDEKRGFMSARAVSSDEDGNYVDDPNRFVYMGCDFAIAQGPRADYDSYIVVEKFGDFTTVLYGERHRGLPIAAKVDRLVELYKRYRPRQVICDQSNVGQAVIDQLKSQLVPTTGVDFAPINRNSMLIGLRQFVEGKKLLIPRDQEDTLCMTFTNVLIKEMVDFKETRTRTGLITYQSDGVHDDTVMSLCLAIKGVATQREFLDMIAL